MRTCMWDLETSHLKANFAQILTGAVKEYGGKTKLFLRDNLPSSDDRKILKDIRDELEEFDIIVTYYGLGFDLKMLNSRLRHFGMKPLSRKLHLDLYPVCKRIFNTHRKSLMAITEFLGIEGKGRVIPEDWVQAAYDGNKTALKKIGQHNTEDVEVLEELLRRIKDDIRGMTYR